MFLPIAFTSEPPADFPQCEGCLKEFELLQDAPGAERKILCPKSPVRVKCGCGDWIAVPARLARLCDGRGSAAAATLKELKEKES